MNRNTRIGLLLLVPMVLFALIVGAIMFLAIATGGRGALRGVEQAQSVICGVGMLLSIPVMGFLFVLPYVRPPRPGSAPPPPKYLSTVMGIAWVGAAILWSASFFLRAYLEDRPEVSDVWGFVSLSLFCLGTLYSWIMLGLPVVLRRSLQQGQQRKERSPLEETPG